MLDIVGPGAVLGEVTFVDDAPRGADVRAAEPSTVMVWERATILDLFVRDPALAAEFSRGRAYLEHSVPTFSAAVASGSVSAVPVHPRAATAPPGARLRVEDPAVVGRCR